MLNVAVCGAGDVGIILGINQILQYLLKCKMDYSFFKFSECCDTLLCPTLNMYSCV